MAYQNKHGERGGCFFVIFLCMFLLACNKPNHSQGTSVINIDSPTEKPPALTGRLVFHRYSCYGCNDSKLFIYNFSTRSLKEISAGWTNIQNAMNAHFSTDGSKLVFMGTDSGTNNWDIYLWRVNSTSLPINLTAHFGLGSIDEDCKFSSSGTKIVFKQNGVLTEMDTIGNLLRRFSVPQSPASMPYYENGDTAILYAGTVGTSSNIYLYHMADASVTTKNAVTGIYSYYPITRDDSSFIFTQWYDVDNKHDQLYLGFFDKRAPQYLPFNEPTADYSDGFPFNGKYLFLSSDRKGTVGGYDLFIADILTGNIWSLNFYNTQINSAFEELGASYTSTQ